MQRSKISKDKSRRSNIAIIKEIKSADLDNNFLRKQIYNRRKKRRKKSKINRH